MQVEIAEVLVDELRAEVFFVARAPAATTLRQATHSCLFLKRLFHWLFVLVHSQVFLSLYFQ